MNIVTRPHSSAFVNWAKNKDDVVVLSGDLTRNTEADEFRDTWPDRFFSMGLAEQNMLSVAGGMAREGLVPFVHTFGVFIYRRAYDQLSMSVAYPNLPVRLAAFLPGVTTPGGVSHQAIEDVALMRAVPNMTVLETGDATDVETLLPVTEQIDGPVYMRMLRGKVQRLFPADEPMRFNQARILNTGSDITVLSSGISTSEAIRAVEALKQRGVSVTHLHISTLKPFDDPHVPDAIAKAKHGVITLENHSVIGGLGSAVAEVIAEHCLDRPLLRLGLKDTYAHGGSLAYLMRHYRLDARALVDAAAELTGEKFDIKNEELTSMVIEPVHGAHKAEAL